MPEAKMKEIIRWLDEKKHPLLVQGPRRAVKTLLNLF
jgi:predicted AAA+ superfamily ATPase